MTPDAWVVVSPHCDDAILSTYSSVLTRHESTVITVFDGVPPAGVQGGWDTLTSDLVSSEVATIRVLEDVAACRQLEVARIGLGFLDGQYRSEVVSLDLLRSSIIEALPEGLTDMSIPAAIGSHPDHVAARDAALRVGVHLGLRMWLHGDLPYGLSIDGWPTPRLGFGPAWSIGEPVVTALGPGAQQHKLDVLRCYSTQFSLLDGPDRVLTGPGKMNHEVLWPVAPSSAKI